MGTLCAIPFTRHEGIFAYYDLKFIAGSCQVYSIGVFYPTPLIKDLVLASGFLVPAIFCAGPAIASGVMYDLGNYGASDTLRAIRHINWIVILYVVPIAAFYYSVKMTLILIADIHLAESNLRVEPKIAFTVEYLLTMSSVRFLLGLTAFTTFGAGVISIVCGSRYRASAENEGNGAD
ncbi:hypothetical protein BGZ72_007579 [Mortierella alpina]|nr:hypothetical protein BGZ72_007579 [Mortierella alpina]